MNQPRFLRDIVKTSGDIWSKGWAERNAGNISVRLRAEELEELTFDYSQPWIALNKPVKDLKNEIFLVSGAGKYLRNIALEPEYNLGIIQIDETGKNYRVVWGYKDGWRPTSELYAHLQSHEVKKRVTNGMNRAIIHTHPANLVALTYALDLDTYSLSRLVWEMHAESILVFPEGIEYMPWIMTGTSQLADATAAAFEKRNLVLWQYHGVISSGKDLDAAFGLIDMADKAAEIYLKATAMGGIKNKPSLSQIKAIAENFSIIPDVEIFRKISENE